MKIERNSNMLNFWKSLSFSILVTSFTFFVVFVLGILLSLIVPFSWMAFSEFIITLTIISGAVSFFGHFVYYHFDVDVRRHCVVCKSKEYVSTMTYLYDDDALESVYLCNKHRVVNNG